METKMHLVITNNNDRMSWTLYNKDIEISRQHSFKFMMNALWSAKRFAKKLNVKIISSNYCEPKRNYYCEMKDVL